MYIQYMYICALALCQRLYAFIYVCVHRKLQSIANAHTNAKVCTRLSPHYTHIYIYILFIFSALLLLLLLCYMAIWNAFSLSLTLAVCLLLNILLHSLLRCTCQWFMWNRAHTLDKSLAIVVCCDRYRCGLTSAQVRIIVYSWTYALYYYCFNIV